MLPLVNLRGNMRTFLLTMAIFAAVFVSNLFWLVVIGLVIEGFYAQGALVMIMSPFLFKKEDGVVPSEKRLGDNLPHHLTE
jgi:hypothetical protein